MPWGNRTNGNNTHIECSLIKQKTVFIESVPREKIELLMDAYPHQEWLAYLVGIEKEDCFFVEDISVPPHASVGSAYAEAVPFHQPKGCLGVIHSHNTMGAFHSGTDHDHVDKNFPVSITVAKRTANLEFDTVTYHITPCGKKTMGKALVKYVKPKPTFDVGDFMTKAQANIDKGKVTTPNIVYHRGIELTDDEDDNGNKDRNWADHTKPFIPLRYRVMHKPVVVDEKTGSVLSPKESAKILEQRRLDL